MVAGRGVPAAAEIEEQKKSFAGSGVLTFKHVLSRLKVPLMCCFSKLWTPKLKLTAQAQWMTVVRLFWSVLTVDLGSPRSSRLRSDGKQRILSTFSRLLTFLVASVEKTRSLAICGDVARTRQYTALIWSFDTS